MQYMGPRWPLTAMPFDLSCLGPPMLLWLALWSAINSGPWHLVAEPEGLVGWVNAVRAAMPLLVLGGWLFALPFRTRPVRVPSGPETLWILYALIALVSGLRFDDSFDNAYWSLAYLAVFAAIEWTLHGPPLTLKAADLNRLNWLIGTLFLVAMLLFARDVIADLARQGHTGYGIGDLTPAVGGAPISRSSGLARLLIVPAIVGFVSMLRGPWVGRFLWACVFAASTASVWFLQSRQGIIGLAFALGLVAALLGGRARVFGIAVMVVVGSLYLGGLVSDDLATYVAKYVTRGEGARAFESMSGRDLIWQRGWAAVDAEPLLGYGPQADRRMLRMNAQSGPLYAALSAGYAGMALYVVGLGWGWWLFLRVFRHLAPGDRRGRLFLVQVGGIMAYLTMRNIPENTAALFSVDLLLYAPLLALLGTLQRERRRHELAVAPPGAWVQAVALGRSSASQTGSRGGS
jgi:hypothetical protein